MKYKYNFALGLGEESYMTQNRESIIRNDILNCRLEFLGLVAIWIVLFHLFSYTGWKSNNIVAVMIQKFLDSGASGVDIFLFLSGEGCLSIYGG